MTPKEIKQAEDFLLSELIDIVEKIENIKYKNKNWGSFEVLRYFSTKRKAIETCLIALKQIKPEVEK